MGKVKKNDLVKIIKGNKIITSKYTILDDYENIYYTTGEKYILITGKNKTKIILNEKLNEEITIKSMCDSKINTQNGLLIDNDYEDIELKKGCSIKLVFMDKCWYVVASDGDKFN